MFVDTSCIVAMIAQEGDADRFRQALSDAGPSVTAPHVLLESTMVLTTRFKRTPADILATVEGLLSEARMDLVPLTHEIARAAVDAFAKYGKGRGHPAQLNFGDCLSYACAKTHGVPLLFKGDDFAQTDVARA